MKIYIRATGNISPQKTFGKPPLLAEPVAYTGNRLNAIEPDYKTIIDPKLIRRMSRIIKMGVAAAMECLQEAGIEKPDAIVTGTAYGCLEDTGVFLSRLVEQQESLLAPTAFIQSTHNTVGAQIALLLHCNGYNNVFVHRGFSFENALLDAMMLLKENEATNVLVGGLDETTDASHAILKRFGLYRSGEFNNLELLNTKAKGTVAGEGAAFFTLAAEASGNDYAQIDDLSTLYKPSDIGAATDMIADFLSRNNGAKDNIDLVITGRNADATNDSVYDELETTVFAGIDTISYKQLCGEYPTSTAFALWLAANITRSGNVPAVLNYQGDETKKIKRVLICNHLDKTHYSLILLSAC